MTSDELRSQAAALSQEIADLSAIDADERTEEQDARLEAALDEVDPLLDKVRAQVAAEKVEEERAAKIAEMSAFAAAPVALQHGDGARVAPVPGASTRNIWDMDEARRTAASPEAFASELRSRAATAIEQSDKNVADQNRERATQLLERGIEYGPLNGDADGTAVARHWLTFGNPEYREHWLRSLHGDLAAMSHCQQVTQRAWAGDGTTTTGGFAIVPDYDTTLLLINDGTTNPMRQLARTVQTNTNKWYGLSTAGVTAAYITESTEEGDDTPAVAQPSIDIHRAGGYLQASLEVIGDSNLGAEVMMLIGDAKDQLEANKFVLGTGGGEPFGVVTQCQTLNAYVFGDSGSTVEKEIVTSDIYALDAALGPRWRPGASFLANKQTWNMVRQLGTSNNYHAFWTDFGGGTPAMLIGYPVYESSVMDSTVVSGSQDDVILLGDFRQGYIIAERLGTVLQYNPLVVGSNRRPTGEVGWFAYWRNGANVTDQTNASHFALLHK